MNTPNPNFRRKLNEEAMARGGAQPPPRRRSMPGSARSRGGWGGRGEAPDHLLREIRALDDRQELIRQKEERLEAEKREREKRGKHARFAHDPAKLEAERERYAAAACTLRAVRPTKWICM